MAPRTLTGANAIITLSAPDVFGAPFQLQGFAADDVFSTEAVQSAEVLMGVDGVMSAGFVFVPIPQNYMLQSDSQSVDFFETFWLQQQQNRTVYRLTGGISLKMVGKRYSMSNGVLTNYTPTADVKKLLQPRKFTITWESVLPAPIAS